MMQGYADAGGELAQLQSTMHAIETACSSIQMHINPAAAETTILALSQSPQPYKACQFILENSKVANARFQAAGAIRDAAVREWGFLSAGDRTNLISFCLCFALQHANSPEGYVQGKVSSVAAQLMKRGWLDFSTDEKEPFFFQINQATLGTHGLDVQFIGISILESLVSEFSPSTSSPMGLPKEFHEQCRRSLELDYLKVFYGWARDAAISITSKILGSDSAALEVKVCTAAMRLMLQILTWEFQYYRSGTKSINIFSAGVRHDNALANRMECILVQPGPACRDVLISSGDIVWLLNLYEALRQKFSRERSWIDYPIAVSARKLLVQYCSVTGTIFPSDNGQVQEHYLVQLLSGIVSWVEPPEFISREIELGKSGSEMLDGCRALLAVATVTSPTLFDRLLKSIRPYGTVTLLSTLMGEVIKVLASHNNEEEIWSWEARDILLDTWTALLLPADSSGAGVTLPPEGAVAAANLFALIVESELKVASASVYSDDSGTDYLQASISAMDERLSSYALIARASIDVTVPFLTKLFTERVSRLHQGRGMVDPTETLEEIYSLLLIIGHVLADEGDGETPLIPDAIQMSFQDFSEADKHPIVILSRQWLVFFVAWCSSIIRFAEQSLDPELRGSFFSPRLMEAIIWFLSRWSPTYLMSLEETLIKHDDSLPSSRHQLHSQDSRKTVASYFSEYSYGKFVLDTIVRISITTFTSYPGENFLQGMTCYQLLHALVRQKNICVHLVALESWRELANAFANEKMLFMLNASHQRSLAQTLVLSASGLGNSEAANQYVRDLMGHVSKYLAEVSSRNDIKTISVQPDTILLITCLLERLRGAARASEPRMQKSIYEMGLSVFSAILVLLEVYKNESSVVYVLLKFVVVWVDAQITYLEANETAALVDFCVRLLQLYSSHNIGKISLSLSSNLLSDAKTEKYKDLRALLQLLSALCLKDVVDFSSVSEGNEGTNISQVVFYGLHIVTPLISLELLKYPKLCHDYFSLLSHMLEVYPEMVAQLNKDAFSHILETLNFSLHHQDSEVVNMCLRALRALASYHYKETAAGKLGLGLHASDPRNPSVGTEDRIFTRFLRSLLQFLLFDDYSPDLVGPAADALFPMILCEQTLYQKLGSELIERQANPTFRLRLTNALRSLTSANQLTCTLDRMNYQRFRKNLTSFLIEVRAFLQTK